MSKLMQERLHLTQRKQCRFILCGLRQVHYYADMWPYVFTFLIYKLFLIRRHPCASLLSFARMEISIEHSKERTITVKHLIGFYIRVIYWNFLILLECDTVEFISQSKHATDNLRQFKIWTQHLGVNVIFFKLQLMRIVGGVPRFEFEVRPLHTLSLIFQLFTLFNSRWLIGINKLM